MSRPVSDHDFWKERLRYAAQSREPHHALFLCSGEQWQAIAARHRVLLADLIRPEDSILDAGCAWGRLLELLPVTWRGDYYGVDVSPDFIELAKAAHPGKRFEVLDLAALSVPAKPYDWAVCVAVRSMIKGNLGDEVWDRIEKRLRLCSRLQLYLHYDEDDVPVIEGGC